MSNFLNKAKEAAYAAKDVLTDKQSNTQSTTGGGNYVNNPQSTNAGPHSSNMANKVDPRIDSDRDGRNDPTTRTGGYGNTQEAYGASGVGPGHTGVGHGSSGVGVGGGNNFGTAGAYDDPRSTNAGPHSSNMANKLDPRVDSDMDRRNNPASHVGGHGQTQQGYGGAGSGLAANTSVPEHGHQAGYGAGTGAGVGNTQSSMSNSQYDNPRSTNDGPHSSNLMNKMDPRVDSDRDHRNDPTSNVGGHGQTQQGYASSGGFADNSAPGPHHGHHQHPGHGAGTGAGIGAGHTQGGIGNTQYDNPRSTNDGPHGSNLMNKMDPRVDSDRDGRSNPSSNVGGYGQTQQGYGGAGSGYADNTTSGIHHGQHQQPGYAAGAGAGAGAGPGFVDSGAPGGQHGQHGHQGHHDHHHGQQVTPGSGDANRTAGPHNSNLLNKLDPRVDSDLDGSKTYAGDRTNY